MKSLVLVFMALIKLLSSLFGCLLIRPSCWKQNLSCLSCLSIEESCHTSPNSSPMLSEDLELQLVIVVRTNVANVVEVLIQWKDLPEYEATWKTFDVINHYFPEFHLEDKVKLLGEIIVSRPPITNVDVRRRPKTK